MKVKVYVIDFEIPWRLKRWGLRIGILVGALVGGGVAFAGLPGGYKDGQALTQAALDANFNYVLGQIPAVTAWSAPSNLVLHNGTLNPLNNQTTQWTWRRVGDSIEMVISTTFSGQPTGSGPILWTLPNGMALDQTKLPGTANLGSAALTVSGTSAFQACDVVIASDYTELAIECNSSGPEGAPSGIQSGDVVRVHASFPVAGWGVQ